MTSSDLVQSGGEYYFSGHTPMSIDGEGTAYFAICTYSNLLGFGSQTIYTYKYRDNEQYFQPYKVQECEYTDQKAFVLLDLQYSKNLKLLFGVTFDDQNFTSILSIDPRTCKRQLIFSGQSAGIHYPQDGSFGGLYETEEVTKYVFLHTVLQADLSEFIIYDLKKETYSRHFRKDYDQYYTYKGGSISCDVIQEKCFMNIFKIPYFEQAKEEVYSIDMSDESLKYITIDETLETQNPDRKTFFLMGQESNNPIIGRVQSNDAIDSFVVYKNWDLTQPIFNNEFDGLNAPFENYCYDTFNG